MTDYTEDTLVQKTTAEFLERELGWTSLYAYNQEGFGPTSLLGRSSDKEVILLREVRKALLKLNPGLPEEAYRDALRQIQARIAEQSLVERNRDFYQLLRDRVTVCFTNDRGQRVEQRLRLLDFDTPENNDFLCVRELWVRGAWTRKRADIVGFVNGFPLVFMELKNVWRQLRAAYEENLRDYLDTIPHLFEANQLIILGNGLEAKLGSFTSSFKHFHEWKRLEEEDAGKVHMEVMLRGVCDKRNLIDLIENFILFDDGGTKTSKIIARNHQFLGVNRAIEKVIHRKEDDGRLGVFWHTQGSGKSYSIAFFTRKVHRKLSGGFTFLVCTDREDLDSQIYDTFADCDLVNNDTEPCRAGTGRHLKQLIGEHKKFIFTLIQKFNEAVDPNQAWSQRDDIIIVTDEAHRSQYGSLGHNLRLALPNASRIGFTGTPLLRDDEITKRLFGDYVSRYDFARAIEDHATVPLYYDTRGDRLQVINQGVNQEMAETLAQIDADDLDDPAVRARVERDLSRGYHILTAQNRLEKIAEDFVAHYSGNWQLGKAMFVCIDKVTCGRMHKQILVEWTKATADLEKVVTRLAQGIDLEALREAKAKLSWMKQTQIAIVISEQQNETADFKNWGLDIAPHRKLIREGFMIQTDDGQPAQKSMEEAFKDETHPFRVAIVCAMWLTGFDVPSLSTLYIDKPMKAHSLMQAIARANRVKEGKENGLIVDYCGILQHLRKALGQYASGEDKAGEEPADDDSLLLPHAKLLEALNESLLLVEKFFLDRGFNLAVFLDREGFNRNKAIQDAADICNTNDETRKRFEVMARAVFSRYKACLMVPEITQYRSRRDAVNIIYSILTAEKNAVDISHIIQKLHTVVDGAISTEGAEGTPSQVYDLSKIDFELLAKEFAQSEHKSSTTKSLKDAVENRLRRLLEMNPLRTDFQDRYEQLVKQYNNEHERVVIEQIFAELLKMSQEMDTESKRAAREGLENEETLALFDLLNKKDLSQDDILKVKKVSKELLSSLKAELQTLQNWREAEQRRNTVKQRIHDFLFNDKTGLPHSYQEEEIAGISSAVYAHVFRVYPRVPSPVYGDAG